MIDFNELFSKHEIANKTALKRYLEICQAFQKIETKDPKYNFHHIYPAFCFKEDIGGKNRDKVIDLLDEAYKPEENVVKIPLKFHLVVHYLLAQALLTEDAVGAFMVLHGDYTRTFSSFTTEEVIRLGEILEEGEIPTKQDRYYTKKEIEEMAKQIQQEQHKAELKALNEFRQNERRNKQKRIIAKRNGETTYIDSEGLTRSVETDDVIEE